MTLDSRGLGAMFDAHCDAEFNGKLEPTAYPLPRSFAGDQGINDAGV
jgi:hypothetical protein